MRRALKAPSEMTAQELQEAAEQCSGLPVPPVNADRETYLQWYVSSVFLTHHRHIVDGEKANSAALALLMQESDFAQKRPYIEQALGCQLHNI